MDEPDFCVGVFGFLALVILLALCTWGNDWYSCGAKTSEQGLEHRWGPFTGCLIKVDDRWIDYDKWRVME